MTQFKLIFRGVFLFGLLSFLIFSCSSDIEEETGDAFNFPTSDDKSTVPSGLGYSRIVKAVSKTVGEERSIAEFNNDGITTGLCFDASLIDVSNNQVIGTVTYCLSDIEANTDGSYTFISTSIFSFNDGSGLLITRGLINEQPTADDEANKITNATGLIPIADAIDIMDGTGDYRNAKGKIHLSGVIDIHNSNEITFNSLFIIPSKRPSYKKNGINILRLKGTGAKRVPSDFEQELGVESSAICFNVELLDARTNLKVGNGTDCLSEIVTVQANNDGLPKIKLNTTVFNFDSGTYATQTLTTLQTIYQGDKEITHITGVTHEVDDIQNNFVYGDGYFSNIEGSSNISGAINMSKLDTEGKVDFDCIFVLNYTHDDLPTITTK
ncbi:hypothetical protein ABW636_10510 [Aquimarina sp. 2201CG1-2-11]|uniref:hypothetical protein n=1 Tax=Aquimarina discodermiae TaxID=3231043 RepID=UPI0034619FBB